MVNTPLPDIIELRPRRRVVARPQLPATPPAPAPDQLLRPAATCPRCGARPAMRVTGAMVTALHGHPHDERVGTYQCQRRGCGAVYDLTAGAYLAAAA
jgi:hypothetical protein